MKIFEGLRVKRRNIFVIVGLVIIFSGFTNQIISTDKDLDGTYKKIDLDYEIIVYLPTSHYKITIIEINESVENSVITNVVNITVTENELDILKNSFTIKGDSQSEYLVNLYEAQSLNNYNQNFPEFVITIIFGTISLVILSFFLIKRFNVTKNPRHD
ncbi:MAG: hypothetical protein HeimC3_20530 [Candidatus Heimdallarchaeota archaeon LC_3]|nr:MAG: hypothetical protein HeimC3_20530 [Candidatus Heimdallarchaeota archaeon LC_3]